MSKCRYWSLVFVVFCASLGFYLGRRYAPLGIREDSSKSEAANLHPPAVDSLPVFIVEGRGDGLRVLCFIPEINRQVTVEEFRQFVQLNPSLEINSAVAQIPDARDESELMSVFRLAKDFGIRRLWYAGAWMTPW